MKKTFRFIIFTLLCLVLSPIGTLQAAPQAKGLRIVGREYPRLDPQMTARNDQAAVENALFRGLLRYDANGNPAPSIAKDVPTVANGGISPDGKTYTYHLRDWNWSDGKGTVTADDFVYSFQRLVDPKTASPYGAFLNGIVVNATDIQAGKMPPSSLGVKAVNATTFQVSLVKPISFFNAIAAMWIGYVVRKDNVERVGLPKPDSWTDPANGAVVGSGPFRMVSWDHNKKIVFERNPYFSGSMAKLDTIEIYIFENPSLAYAAYKNDELEIASLPPTEQDAVKADAAMSKQLVQYSVSCTNYLGMNNAVAPFDNKLVREAFSYALNRDLREHVVDKDINIKQLSWLPEGVPGYDAEVGKPYDFNAEKARKALADAGYADGKGFPEVTFSYVGNDDGQRTADWYKEQFKKVLNIDIKLNPMDIKDYLASFDDPNKRLHGLYEYGWCSDYLHPSDWLYLAWGKDQVNNVVGYSSDEFDKLSKAADAELDPQKALDLYKQAHEQFLSDFPIIIFDTPRSTKLVKPWVHNLTPNSLDGGMIGGFFWEDITVTP